MGKLVMVPWDWDAPCHTHGCYGRIKWKIVPETLKDVAAAVFAGICDDCRDSLLESTAVISPQVEREEISTLALEPVGTTEQPKKPARKPIHRTQKSSRKER